MKNYTRVRVRYTKPTEHAKSIGIKEGQVIAEFIYKIDNHALALYQCRKDNPAYDERITLEATTIDIEDERYKDLYRVLEENEQVFDVED